MTNTSIPIPLPFITVAMITRRAMTPLEHPHQDAERPPTANRKEKLFLFSSWPTMLMAAGIFMLGAAQTVAAPACKPRLTVEQAQFSEAKNQQRRWSAVLNADASACAALSGAFEMQFIRLKEMAPDLAFVERFTWTAGRTEISLDFWWDEAVLEHSIRSVAPCPCRK
ncbi:MAG: hypothetical protein ACJ8F3_04345 [Xanthobacteraceae bacterium]